LLDRSAQSNTNRVNITLTSEQQVALFNRNSARTPPSLTALYPKRAAVWQDYTACRSDADWVVPERREATALFQRFLASEQAQSSLPRFGFRPSVTQRADPTMLGPAVGIDLSLPSAPSIAVDSGALSEILSHWGNLVRPVSMAVVVDTSSSMEGDALTATKDALREFFARMPMHLLVSLVSFSNEPKLVVPFTSDRVAPIAALDSLIAQGGSSAFDGIQLGLDTLSTTSRPKDRQILLVITDGEGQSSQTTQSSLEAALRQQARDRDITVMTITISREGANYQDLESITKAADGRFKAVEIGDLSPLIEDLLKSL
ncbi:MAG: VWA domain-containing protein, partial [Proteobacteria bacterium]|nr:VWA domain-containing protein [Pseudomonadota bacterium]